MKMKQIMLIAVLFSFLSCMTTDKEVLSDLRKINDCAKHWIIDTTAIKHSMEVTVLLYDKQYEVTGVTFPFLLIGVTIQNDTIALIDKSFTGNLSVGQTVTLVHEEWTDDETQYLHPLPVASKDRKRNSLYCSVKVLYRGKILQ